MGEVASGADKAMGRFLLDGEQIVVSVHQHWIRVTGVLAATVLGLALVLLIGLVTPASAGLISDLSIWLWLWLLAYCIVQVLLWRHNWFVATDRRLLLTYGLVSRKVAMMPLAKVTDMSFNQSATGRILGYGTYVMESAGQDQALRQIDYIPDAELHYRSICAEIFGERDPDDLEDDNDTHHQPRRRHADRGDDTDPYGIPVQRAPVGLDVDARRRPAHDGRRARVVRAATVVPNDPDASWSTSHEDAPPHQSVRPHGEQRVGDDPA